jgi:hypothetical protein
VTVEQAAIFARYLLPLYPPDARADLEEARKLDANPGKNPSVIAHLDDAARVFVLRHEAFIGRDLGLDFTDASVHRLGAALTREVIERLARGGAPGTPESELFNVVVHGVAYVGTCIIKQHGGEWLVRRPLWESRVRLRSRAGDAELAILSWWLNALANDTLGLAERYRAYVEVPTAPVDSMPVIAPPRPLPRLTKVRYDTLVKYLHAHLPELRDVGKDFPSAPRFEAYRFAWLDFHWLGDGRMLLLLGPGEGGLHLFWLDASGFQKSVLLESDRSPEPTVHTSGDKLAVTVSSNHTLQTHEMLWWGP